MEAGDVMCDACGQTVPIPSRAGYTCNASVPGGYCPGTLQGAGYFAAKAAEDAAGGPEAEKPAKSRGRRK